MSYSDFTPKVGLDAVGLTNLGGVMWNASPATLYEEFVMNGEGVIAADGPMCAETGKYTGRSPEDKFVVEEPSSKDKIWWGKVNRPISEEKFDGLLHRVQAYLQDNMVYVQDCWAGAEVTERLPIRVVTQLAWHSLFARNMFIPVTDADDLRNHEPQFTIISAPGFKADPAVDGTRSEAFILVHFGRGIVLIGGTSYAGEIKKSIFTIMNYVLPLRGVLSMHCSANEGPAADSAVFFGLSGTGKTTLSADPKRRLIGDDEHGWTDLGIFNFEGGCYAKVIRLSAEAEPEIYKTTRTFGTVLENVVMDERGVLDLDDDSKTENTRAAYKLEQIANALPAKQAGHPMAVVMLTADAFGILPPIARLTRNQAMFYFLSGFTAKLAGTEIGVKEPQPTFSACFGAPFLPQPPVVYARLLAQRLDEHGSDVWLV
ncbi:MAG TPA: phosphoenolpyruvate carboxykinase (ATP), partial [Candidatus Krumholzibacteria bacterium]|nr:phosphoenolpyruvate carboxykinase (ATP) [Candidatus Krumholzibacteria bacterium]